MIRKIALIGISLAALGLGGCDRPDRSPTEPEAEGATGSARVALPKLPDGYLAGPAEKALFELAIEGEGMNPIRRAWALYGNRAEPVVVEGIPAGKRMFRGWVIRSRAGGNDTTHAGSDSALVVRDSTVDVHLFLRALGRGDAHICLEVEGWPADTSCSGPDTGLPQVAGCYRLQVTKPGPELGPDTLFTGKLSVRQSGRELRGAVDWGEGRIDSAVGQIDPGGLAFFGSGGFTFKGHTDKPGVLWGHFTTARGIEGGGEARAIPCDSAVPGDTAVIPSRFAHACFDFRQSVAGDTTDGSLALRSQGDGVARVFIRWENGYRQWTETSYLSGSIGSTAGLIFSVNALEGIFPADVEAAEYALDLAPTGTSNGKIFASRPGQRRIGDWQGVRRACTESDFLVPMP
jgi:hypothetical protein